MATRKPIVIGSDGTPTELPTGDALFGIPLALAAWLSSGTRSDIPLTSQYKLQAWLSSGTQSDIGVILSG